MGRLWVIQGLVVVLVSYLLEQASGQSSSNGLFTSEGGISLAVRDAALPLGVSQIIMAPSQGTGVNQFPDQGGQNREGPTQSLVRGYGASIAWTPTTTGAPRVIVGNVGVMNTVNSRTVYGAAYVYTSDSFSFTLQQRLLPPAQAGAAGLLQTSRFGTFILASPNSVRSPVLSGTNLWVAQSIIVPTAVGEQGVESVYFYSATVQTEGLTRNDYLLRQTIGITTAVTCNFGVAMASSHSDMTLVVGAPGYPDLAPSNPSFTLSGPTSGRVFIFQWNTATNAFTAQAILTAAQGGVANEIGFGLAVAMSGNVFAVGSMGGADVTGQLAAGIGNVYIFSLQAPIPGLNGAASAFTAARFVQTVPNMPISNSMSMSMTGNYLCVGVQDRALVFVMNTLPGTPNFNNPSRRAMVGSGNKNAGMGQIVVSQTIDGLLYVYMGQPNLNVGAIYSSNAPESTILTELGVQGGLEPGFGSSLAFNKDGNYLFAGNFLNNPHALVVSLYFETQGKAAARQRLISNDVQTANSGVFSNFGSVISGQQNAVQSVIAIGASLGPTFQGRVYIYTLQKGTTPQFSLQAEMVAQQQGSNFGASIATMLSTGNDIAILIGAPSTSGSQIGAYIDIFIATAGNTGILATATGTQRLTDPKCVPLSNVFSCGANYGGNVVVDGMRIIVGAHNFGVQPGTGRVYVYLADLTRPRSQMFSLQQTLISPASEYGFGVALALVDVIQNAHTPAVKGAATINSGTQTTMNVLHVASMGQPRDPGDPRTSRYPFTQPQGVGMVYVYVNTLQPGQLGQPYSQLQVLVDTPVPLTTSVAGTGAAESMQASINDMYVGNAWRNEVRFYRYNGIRSYTLQQTLRSPYGVQNFGGYFGSSIFNTRSNRGLLVGAPGNGTVFMYLNVAPITQVGTFNLIRVLAARPIADRYGEAVSSCGDTVVVGAPGANVATIYPIMDILKLPPPGPMASPPPPPSSTQSIGTPTLRPQAPPAASQTVPIAQPPQAAAQPPPSSPPPPPPPTPVPVANPTPVPFSPWPTPLPWAPPSESPTISIPGTDEEEEGGENTAAAQGSAAAKDEKLSDGAIAGIVVGIILAIMLAMIALWCNRRNSNAAEEKMMQERVLEQIVRRGSEALPPPMLTRQSIAGQQRGSAGAFDHHQVYSDAELGSPGGRHSISRASYSRPGPGGASQAHRGGPPGGMGPPPHMTQFGPAPGWERNSVARQSMTGRAGPRASMHDI